MDDGCTCNERTRISRHAILVSQNASDNRPNGSAVRGLFYYRHGDRGTFLIKEGKRCRSSKGFEDSEGQAPREKCLIQTTNVDAVGGGRCSKACESELARDARLKQASTSLDGSDQWDEEMLAKHIKDCKCTCNHMGFGNYLDWDETARLAGIPPAPPRCLPTPRSYGAAGSTLRSELAEKHRHIKSPGDGTSPSEQETPSDKGRTSRPWCIACILLLLLTLTGIGVVLPLTASLRHGSYSMDHLVAVKRMLKEVPLIDGHNDLAWNVRNYVHNQLHKFNFSTDLRHVSPWSTSSWSQTDLPRLREGQVGAQFWSAYVPCEAQYKDAVQLTLEQINVIRRLVDSYAELQFSASAQDIETAHAEGRIASLIGVEGGHSLGASLGVLRAMYDLGMRYLTLTHSCHTP